MSRKKITFNYAVDYFKNLGYPEHIARGIAGNLGHESEFNADSVNSQSKMYGLAQWDSKRRAQLQKFAKIKNADLSDPDTQLNFVHNELQTTEKKAYQNLLKTKNPEEAATVFAREYERMTPKGKAEDPNEIAGRAYYALNGTRIPKGKGIGIPGTQTSPEVVTTNGMFAETKADQIKRSMKGFNLIAPTMSKSNYTSTVPAVTSSNVEPVISSELNRNTTTMARPQSKMDKMKGIGTSIAPYLSNIYNMSRKPAKVPMPVFDSPISLNRVNMNYERGQAGQDYRTSVNNLDQTLDANTAVAAKMAQKAQKFNMLSKINQDERNTNIGIGNQQVMANATIASKNNERLYNTRLLDAERQNTIISQQSANMANASDKFMAQQNYRAQLDLERDKTDLLYANDTYGTMRRLMDEYEKRNKTKKFGGSLYTAGRMMRTLKPIKTVK